ncbi:WD repeat-containing protein 4 [Clydaea vesicula]|uniref:WD repeat-containing protein 4 n=1 Tax=Clydaea vesicula TaxID=447962 RepID=A0AAD5XYS4_9FUNG|nr:WD repeat-containing protein 4 [Clydaea vesicula]KAJ3390749.1 WD repeat-containing protein 4 [Lobulomyces angularis]
MISPFHKILSSKKNKKIILVYTSNLLVVDSSNGEILAASSEKSSESNKSYFKIESSLFPSSNIRSIALSEDESELALISEDKQIANWNLTTYSRTGETQSIKRANAVQYSRDGTSIAIADKFGDLYVLKKNKLNQNSIRLHLGHVSMLLDFTFSIDGKHIITCERDEKIRVSNFPNSFIIDCYCLGHKEYVNSIHIPRFATDMLISGGGDALLILWKFKTGKEIDRFDIAAHLEKLEVDNNAINKFYTTVMEIKSYSNSNCIAVVLEKQPFLLLLRLVEDKLTFMQKINVPKDILSMDFDSEGNIWMCFGAVSFKSEDTGNNLVAISRFNKEKNLYSAINVDDPLTSKINNFGTTTVDNFPDYYEVSQLGKSSIKAKLEINAEKFNKNKEMDKIKKMNKKGAKNCNTAEDGTNSEENDLQQVKKQKLN